MNSSNNEQIPFHRNILALLTLFALIISLSLPAIAGDENPPENWSNFAGDGNFVLERQGLDLVDDVNNIRVDWKNPTHTGHGKGSAGELIDLHRAGFDPAFGETANTIVADGTVFVSWSQPSGDVQVPRSNIDHRYYSEEDKKKVPDSFWRIDADWRTIAIDADTGETLWEAREKSASRHFLCTKHPHVGVSGAYGDGMYMTITITGNVFAYDAESGDLRWKTTVPEYHQWATKRKKKLMKTRNLQNKNGFTHRRGSAIVDGVAVVPDFRDGIIGLDTESGKQLWRVKNSLQDKAIPQPWTHDGKTWLLCNGPGDRKTTSTIRLIDPETGEVAWSHHSGSNTGCLIFGEKYLMLDVPDHPKAKEVDWQRKNKVFAGYKLSPDGLEKAWQFDAKPRYTIKYRAGHESVIRDGVLYAITENADGDDARLRSFDVRTGELLHEEQPVSSNVSLYHGENKILPGTALHPRPVEDKLILQQDGLHSGNYVQLRMYQLKSDGGFERLGWIRYKHLGIKRMGGYEHLAHDPYYDGRLYLRGHYGIYALDLRKPVQPMARLQFHDLWAGAPDPVDVRLFEDENGHVRQGHIRVPGSSELGVPFTTGRRSNGWGTVKPHKPISIGEKAETAATVDWATFATEVNLSFDERDGDTWTGTWTHSVPGLEQPIRLDGDVSSDSRAGYTDRFYPTPWLDDQPYSKRGVLPAGQRRVVLKLPRALPYAPNADEEGDPKGLTVCLDHNGETFTGAVAGAFAYNQGWHEIDTGNLNISGEGISGSMDVIVHPDPWWVPNPVNNGSLAGRVTLEVDFGEELDSGRRKVTGTWEATWGINLTRTGKITSTRLQNMK